MFQRGEEQRIIVRKMVKMKSKKNGKSKKIEWETKEELYTMENTESKDESKD